MRVWSVSDRSGTQEHTRHRPSHPYPLPWAVDGEQQRREGATLERRKLPRQQNCRLEYFDRPVCNPWAADSTTLISCLFITLYSSCTFQLRHPEKRLFTPRPPTNPSLSCLDLSAPHQCTQCTRILFSPPAPGLHQLWGQGGMGSDAMQPTSGQGLSGLPPADRINY